MKDSITREVMIKAPQKKIYEAITDPEKVVLWFPDAVEGAYAVGERPLFVFNGHGKAQMYIVEARPNDYFSYRWIPGGSDFVGDVLTVPNTLVEFKIEEQKGGMCKVTLIESGFSKLPANVAENAFKMNSGGWDYFMLDSLKKYFA